MTGSTIFLGDDQVGLDAQYNNRVRFPDYLRHFEQWKNWSEETRRRLPCRLDLPFGPSPEERLDLFPAPRPDAPLYFFIHGGYWYSLDKSDYSYIAAGMNPHGVATAVNNFGLAPATTWMRSCARTGRRWLGCRGTRASSAPIRRASMSPATRPAGTWRRCCSPPTGRPSSPACRPTW
jgi:hypothetical protein